MQRRLQLDPHLFLLTSSTLSSVVSPSSPSFRPSSRGSTRLRATTTSSTNRTGPSGTSSHISTLPVSTLYSATDRTETIKSFKTLVAYCGRCCCWMPCGQLACEREEPEDLQHERRQCG
ncbi:hypothetical protein CPB84DRAFT_1795162 [Gymnopilus junonius]|uniref:Uncharacterized protein n=1 Tax=Gymnopilus junonius TaxID=109634 RepID=A0A9P5N9Z1_GYMJU|nr:hypothetical protein CPB84DRAFT_1795162 [Gymnopilus junonius]